MLLVTAQSFHIDLNTIFHHRSLRGVPHNCYLDLLILSIFIAVSQSIIEFLILFLLHRSVRCVPQREVGSEPVGVEPTWPALPLLATGSW